MKTLTIDLQRAAANPPPIDPPPPPATLQRPAWADGTLRGEVRVIPNSQPITESNLWLINDSCIAAGMPPMAWGASYVARQNKFGHYPDNSAGSVSTWPDGNGFSPYGAAPDPRNGRIFVPYGDISKYWLNGWCMFDFNRDSPGWTSEVLPTSNYGDIRVNNLHVSPSPADDGRVERNYDSSARNQHGYSQRAYLPGRNWLGYIGHQQFGPSDTGGSPKTVMGNLTTRQWILDDALPDRPGWSNDVQDMVTVDHVSGNPFSWSNAHGLLSTIDTANPVAWRAVNNGSIPGLRPSFALDYELGEVLVCETAQRSYLVNMTTGQVRPVSITGSKVGAFTPLFYGGLTYCEHLHAYLYCEWAASGTIFILQRTGPTSFSCEPFPMSIAPMGRLNHLGGILNDFFAVPSLGGCVLRVNDWEPMRFIGTA